MCQIALCCLLLYDGYNMVYFQRNLLFCTYEYRVPKGAMNCIFLTAVYRAVVPSSLCVLRHARTSFMRRRSQFSCGRHAMHNRLQRKVGSLPSGAHEERSVHSDLAAQSHAPRPLPKGPCKFMVHTWALKGFPYPYFEVHLCTILILGPCGSLRVQEASQGDQTPPKESPCALDIFAGRRCWWPVVPQEAIETLNPHCSLPIWPRQVVPNASRAQLLIVAKSHASASTPEALDASLPL